MPGYLIKDTTKEERKQIVEESLGNISIYIFFINAGFILYISHNFHILFFRHVYILTIIFGFVHIFIGIFQKNKL